MSSPCAGIHWAWLLEKQASRGNGACLRVSAAYVRAVISASDVCLRRTKLKCITRHSHDPSALSNAAQHILTLSCIHFHKTISPSTIHLFPKPNLSSFIVSTLAFPPSASQRPVCYVYAIAYIIPPSQKFHFTTSPRSVH